MLLGYGYGLFKVSFVFGNKLCNLYVNKIYDKVTHVFILLDLMLRKTDEHILININF